MQILKTDENGRTYIEISKGYKIRVETEEVTGEWKEKARRELRETPENVEKGLKELRELLEADDTLLFPTELDEFLIKFLRPTKYYAQSAYNLIKNLYEFKSKYPNFCHNATPETGKDAFECGNISFEPLRDIHGRRITVFHCEDWSPDKVPVTKVFRSILVTMEMAMLEPMTQVNGFVIIIDMKYLNFRHCLEATPGNVRMFMDFVQNCLPLRMKAIHLVNYPVFFHRSNFDVLKSEIGEDRLRPIYGGTMDCEDNDGKLVSKGLLDLCDEFEYLNSIGIVENKHLVKSRLTPQPKDRKPGSKYIFKRETINEEIN